MKNLLVVIIGLASQIVHAQTHDTQITVCGTTLNYNNASEMFSDGETPLKMVKQLLGEAKVNAKSTKVCILEDGSLALVLIDKDNQAQARIITAP